MFGLAADACDRRDVAEEIEAELVVERRIDRVRRTDQQQRVAVGSRAHHGLGGNIGGSPGPVFDNELLAKPLGQPLPHKACKDVVPAGGGKTDNDAHRPRGVALRLRNTRDCRQHGRTRCEMKKLSTGKFHNVRSWEYAGNPPSIAASQVAVGGAVGGR